MKETIIIPIPEGFTKKQVFEILADANNYKQILKKEVLKSELKQTFKEADEFARTVKFVNAQDNKDGTFTVNYKVINEYQNPISKYDFGIKIYGEINKNLLRSSINTLKQIQFENQNKIDINFDNLIIE